MRKIFQIVFCVLSAVCAAAAVPLGTFFGLAYAIVAVAAAVAFFLAMMLAKYGFRKKEEEQEKTDFMNTPEENEKIRRENEEKTK